MMVRKMWFDSKRKTFLITLIMSLITILIISPATGIVTIKAAGDQSCYIGESIHFFGTDTTGNSISLTLLNPAGFSENYYDGGSFIR